MQIINQTITGSQDTTYLRRIGLGLRDGRSVRLHIFHRGDEDPDPHDHPWDFWTFPLRGYFEKPVWSDGIESMSEKYVRAFRWHRRPAEYRHRVMDPIGGRKIYTIVVTGRVRRKWGFWKQPTADQPPVAKWVHWKTYLGINGVAGAGE